MRTTLKQEREMVKEYLLTIVDKKLFEKEQDELISFIGLHDKTGVVQKTIGILNAYLEANKQPFIILQKTDYEDKKYWEVKATVEF